MKKKKSGRKRTKAFERLVYFRDFARAGDLDLSIRLGHITEDEKILLQYYRLADPGAAAALFNIIKSPPRQI